MYRNAPVQLNETIIQKQVATNYATRKIEGLRKEKRCGVGERGKEREDRRSDWRLGTGELDVVVLHHSVDVRRRVWFMQHWQGLPSSASLVTLYKHYEGKCSRAHFCSTYQSCRDGNDRWLVQ